MFGGVLDIWVIRTKILLWIRYCVQVDLPKFYIVLYSFIFSEYSSHSQMMTVVIPYKGILETICVWMYTCLYRL